uniref:Gag-Pol polyprotein n=1 Tax=Tanacetum cinerariifolium TaxID=118510 RepID=A0A6L2N8M6_TANCI|nr:hypothetical protein [Tanacetum cinerariifolium]
MFVPSDSTVPKLQTAKDLQGDAFLHYDAEIMLMNLIILSIPNDIYNSVEACTLVKDMWKRVERLMRGTIQNNSKEVRKSHDPLALVAYTGSSSRNTSSYYVTHPTSMVDYEDEYQQDDIQTNSEDPLTFALLTLRNISLGNTSTVQCYNFSGKGHYARNCPKPRVWDSKYFMEQMLMAKQDEAGVILTDDFLFADASRTKEIEDLSANICLMARIQPTNHSFDVGPSYDSAFASEADQRAKQFDQQAQSQFIRDQDIIQDLEQQRDKLELVVNDYKWLNEEFQETRLILKSQMSEKEDSYHDTIIDLEDKLKKNVDLILKQENSLQGMFMLGPKTLSVYDQQLKHGLRYSNPYTLKQEIAQCPKLYLASSLGNSEIPLNVRDNKETLDDASKSQQKIKEKISDPIAVANKQNCSTVDYQQINALYKDFVHQKELSAE